MGDFSDSIALATLSASTAALVLFSTRHFPCATLGWVLGAHQSDGDGRVHAIVYPATSEGESITFQNDVPALVNGARVMVQFRNSLGVPYRDAISRYAQMFKSSGIPYQPKDFAALTEIGGLVSTWNDEFTIERAKIDFASCVSWVDKQLSSAEWEMQIGAVVAGLKDRKSWCSAVDSLLKRAEELLTERLREHEAHVLSLAAERKYVGQLLSDFRQSAARYRPNIYVAGGPPISPCGTNSFIRRSLRPHVSWDPMYSDSSNFEAILNDRLERLDTEVLHLEEKLPRRPILDPITTGATYERSLRAMKYATPTVLGMVDRLGHEDPALVHKTHNSAEWLPLILARKRVAAALNKSARSLALERHPATAHELIFLNSTDYVSRRLACSNKAKPEYSVELTDSLPPCRSSTQFCGEETGFVGDLCSQSIARIRDSKVGAKISLLDLPRPPYFFPASIRPKE